MATLFEMLGNAADVPGGMIRNLISGNNPFSPIFSPLSQDGRASGQEVLQSWGLGPGHDLGGLAVEMLTDPLSLLGGSMALKGAKALKLVPRAKSAASSAIGFSRNAIKSPAATKAAAKQIGTAIQNNFVPAVRALPGTLVDAAYDPRYQNLIGGSLLMKLTNDGRASDDYVVNSYLRNR